LTASTKVAGCPRLQHQLDAAGILARQHRKMAEPGSAKSWRPAAETKGISSMSLPLKTSIREDALPLQRAMRALDDAKKSLKAFSQTRSVETDPSLATSVEALRRKVKRARKFGKDVASRWTADATF
jgi:hypothetical protein